MTTPEQAKQVSKTLREYRNYKLICTQAADTIDALVAENEMLLAALEHLAIEVLGPELHANSPCQASDFELIANNVNDLRAALQERDAEIAELKSIAYSDDGAGGEGMKLFLQVRAQRKVLEQAGDALNRFVYAECNQLSHHGKKEMHDFDKPCPVAAKVQAAITAIQGVLKS